MYTTYNSIYDMTHVQIDIAVIFVININIYNRTATVVI